MICTLGQACAIGAIFIAFTSLCRQPLAGVRQGGRETVEKYRATVDSLIDRQLPDGKHPMLGYY